MGYYYYPENNMDCGFGTTGFFIQNDIIIASTAIDEATAETFTTGIGKLAVPDNAESYPEFDSSYIPSIVIVPTQDYQIILVRDQSSVDPATGALSYKAYIGQVGTPPASGVYKYNLTLQG